ncbi:L-ribulose-5-phosphate 3-epimerase [Ruminiclostridium sufflavum DSM 19573]|uniref:L-ribulose-5-phosphate 3-epimerase n=1 Tax=Ruminiclostridium sufflavum DSM 19573 TaxID=1121337 RepID=A0A318XRI4_9FIRM|nr:L-ribulose-5-phosphate 3-epimerase [Ruminiclostridium sufflavum]PYG90269.1 L-ribulose-5-phosphate 3-epimerase [Ruminiclostridium sufflavum DSM 19573]
MRAYTLGLYEKAIPGQLSWREKLEAAKNADYDYLEMSIDETDEKLARLDMPKTERLELVKTMFETGVPIRTMCLSGHRKYPMGSSNPDVRKRSMDIMEKAIRLADDLGIRIIMIAGYDVYYEESTPETRKSFAENLKASALIAAKYGIMLEFETMETEFMNTVWKAVYYIKQINSPYLGIYPDSGNIKNAAVLYGSDEYDDLKAGAGYITSIHLKETVPGKFREIPYGTGHVNFEKIIETAWNIGIRKYVTEFWYTGSGNWMQDLKDVNLKMRNILDAMK